MRCLLLALLAVLACGCARLAQYGDPDLRPSPPPAEASVSASAPGQAVEVRAKGTVRRLDADGGFWGVRADDGRRYRLESLPPVYQKDGTRIRFTGRVRGASDLAPWQTVLDLTEVSGA
jgi:hypothetical protein